MTDLDKLIYAVELGHISTDHLIDALEHPLDMWGLAAFDGSLDAAMALMEALLPVCDWGIDSFDYHKYVWVGVEGEDGIDCYNAKSVGNNPSRAWLLAILKAYRSMQ